MVSLCIRKFIGLRGFEEMDNQGNIQDSVSGAPVLNSQVGVVPTSSNEGKGLPSIKNLFKTILPALLSAAIIAIVADFWGIGPMETRIENIDKNVEKISVRLDKVDGSDENSLVSRFNILVGQLEKGNNLQFAKR